MQQALSKERLTAILSGFFGLLAALLAAIGLFGVASYLASRRRKEIGIRMALGATRSYVIRLMMREAGVLLAIGLAIGTLLTLIAGKAVSAMLFGLRPDDPATPAAAALSFAAVTITATFVPSRRTARLDPMLALRDE